MVLKMVSSCLRSGRKKLVNEATKIVKNLWVIQTLDWKVIISYLTIYSIGVYRLLHNFLFFDNIEK